MSSPRIVIIDFETFFDTKAKYTLRDLSYPEYVLDRRFRVFGMAVNYGGDESEWVPADQIPSVLETLQDDILVMHNAFFDAAVLTWHFKFRPAYMIDTLQLANHVLGSSRDVGEGGNDLASLARRLGLEAKQTAKLKALDGIADLDEAQMASLSIYAKQDATLERQVLDILLPQMSNTDFELWLLDHSLRIYTEKTLEIDAAKLKATQRKIEARRKEVFKQSGVPATVLNSNKQFAEELTKRLKAAKIKVPMKMSAPSTVTKQTRMIPALAKSDPAFQQLAESDRPEIASLVTARIIERSAVTVAARLATMQKYVDLGIGIPVHLVYYGAHTGRFAGGGGFNFQNLTSENRATDPFSREVARLVRECIVAGKGMVFVPVDAAQIEARVLAWLAGEDQILEAFAAGADIYSEFISDAIGENIHKPTGKEPPEVQHYLKLMRQVGKEAVLGLGYSMGVNKFRERLRKEKDLRPMLEKGGKLDLEVCEQIVQAYRDKYTNVTDLWRQLNKAFEAAVKGAIRKVGPLKFQREEKGVVSITLPSTRKLYYRNLRQVPEKSPNGMIRKVWKHGNGQRIYGGLLAENVTQAVARDILAESILAAEQAGYPVALHIHDEIVPRVPKVQGDAALKFLIKSLSTPPAWGKGLVLDAEGHVAETLAK